MTDQLKLQAGDHMQLPVYRSSFNYKTDRSFVTVRKTTLLVGHRATYIGP